MEIIGPLLISTIAGLSTMVGGLIIFLNVKKQKEFITFCLSFSLSVMFTLSIVELIPESFKTLILNYNFFGIIYFLIAFIIGIILVILSNKMIRTNNKNNLYRVGVLSMIALFLHNFPEGIATFMSAYTDIKLGISLGIAIMMHNIPEGISIAIPIYYSTGSKSKALLYTFVSGIAEPIGAIMTYLVLKNYINNIMLSLVLSLVSGIMITLSINKLLPEANKYNKKAFLNLGLLFGIILVLFNILVF